MNQHPTTLLVVDDEPLNQAIIGEYLESADAGYHWDTADDGKDAWRMLEQTPERYSAILLDRMMPGLDGMEVLARIKKHPQLKEIPVILQTARAARQDVVEGIQAGAHYYLTKPFQEDELLSIVRTAITDYQRYIGIRQELESNRRTLGLMHSCRFRYRTLDEARSLAALLAQACPDPQRVVTGLTELMINAVEHGNLGITYHEKSQLNETGSWEQEVNRRLQDPAHQDKWVEVTFTYRDDQIHIHITDQGSGFDCSPYLEISAERAGDNHGRGIAMARLISFEHLEYLGKGNQVLAVIQAPSHTGTEVEMRAALS
ncbi:MAG TPA: response regulator [Sedimenticola thiotaurini]|uniref:Response regulator n=1 Tax=Sedimenticola thiotaurini TaxID=1543721 RepID=A0A831RKB3_9GAMM|nr:response regulator [Sedimenticola thiotaurini]